MAFDAFVSIDGIEGESSDHKHQGWIELLSYSAGLYQRTSSTDSSVGGASSERADFNHFNFTKFIDMASPQLVLACADGRHIDKVIVELCRAGTKKQPFMQYCLRD